jgi:hypothetical protein
MNHSNENKSITTNISATLFTEPKNRSEEAKTKYGHRWFASVEDTEYDCEEAYRLRIDEEDMAEEQRIMSMRRTPLLRSAKREKFEDSISEAPEKTHRVFVGRMRCRKQLSSQR